jgi:hypothetical protein
MPKVKDMLDTYPRTFNVDADLLARTIEALIECANTCSQCADACLSEDSVADLAKCIRLNLDCAEVCLVTSRSLSRQTEYDANLTRPLLEACAAACKSCGDEWPLTLRTWPTAASAQRAADAVRRPAARFSVPSLEPVPLTLPPMEIQVEEHGEADRHESPATEQEPSDARRRPRNRTDTRAKMGTPQAPVDRSRLSRMGRGQGRPQAGGANP